MPENSYFDKTPYADTYSDTVTISMNEFLSLKENETYFRLVKLALFKAARLNYNEKGLIFDDDLIATLLELIAPSEYALTYDKLIARKEDEND